MLLQGSLSAEAGGPFRGSRLVAFGPYYDPTGLFLRAQFWSEGAQRRARGGRLRLDQSWYRYFRCECPCNSRGDIP